jgi:glutamate synthase (NADPH/NADH) large chain
VWQLDQAKVNTELVDLRPVSEEHEVILRDLVERHATETGSRVAQRMLDNWPQALAEFTSVIPRDYQRVVQVIRAAQAAGREIDETLMAELAAPPAVPSPSSPPKQAVASEAMPEVARA